MEAASHCSPVQLLRPPTWTKILEATDKAVAANPDAGFTTLVAFCITKAYICGASSGDSAAVLLNKDEPGVILTARQHKNPPVGSQGAIFVHLAANLSPPWVVLAMSDGVWKYAGWETVFKIASAKRGGEVIQSLRDCARLERSGKLQDDFTVVVFHDGSL
jgi:hypothetical protein